MRIRLALALTSAMLASTSLMAADHAVTVGGTSYVSQGLVAVGHLPANLRDKFGETFGSASGMAMDAASWRRTADGFTGTLFLLPDRGYNVEGTTDYRSRLNRLTFDLAPTGPGQPAPTPDATLRATLADTMLLVDRNGMPLTGLDPTAVLPAQDGLPDLPITAARRISLDSEAIVRLADGSFFISDEYGPYIYRFSAEGKMLGAIRPPDALIPMRNGHEDFSSNNPGPGAPAPKPADPETGRQNNQGFEGMSLTPDGKTLVVVLQSATRQDGGDSPTTRRNTRALAYDVSDLDHPKLVHEYAVPLPTFTNEKGQTRVAAQSELLAIGNNRFLILCRDSGNGYGQPGDTSLYRRIEVLDFAGATDLAGTAYDGVKPIAPKGVLDSAIKPATLTSLIDINDAADLARFGLHSGAPNDKTNLSEKWEAMTLASVLDPATPDDYFLFVGNDNDFLTQDGFQVGAPYRDPGGADVDTRILVYRVRLPGLATR